MSLFSEGLRPDKRGLVPLPNGHTIRPPHIEFLHDRPVPIACYHCGAMPVDPVARWVARRDTDGAFAVICGWCHETVGHEWIHGRYVSELDE